MILDMLTTFVFANGWKPLEWQLFSEIGMMDLYESSTFGPILARIEVDIRPSTFPGRCQSVRHWFLELVGAPLIEVCYP